MLIFETTKIIINYVDYQIDNYNLKEVIFKIFDI